MAGIPKSTRSGGPKSEAGKVASSRNSLKTGAYSSMTVIPGESEEDFRGLHEEFLASFKPSDVAESSMVRELAVLTWKKLRLERLEQAAFVRALKVPVKALDICLMVPVEECHDWLIRDIGIVTNEFIATYMELLEFLRPGSDNIELNEKFMLLASKNPEFFERFRKEHLLEEPYQVSREYLGHKLDNQAYQDQLPKGWTLPEAKQWLNQIQWVAEHLDEIKAAIASVKEKRLLDLMQDQGIVRAHDDLSRAFYRTLSELRRQQSWRQKIGIIDVTSE
jgi:hypothetical protein